MSNFQQIISGQFISAASGTYTFDVDTKGFQGIPINITISSTFSATATSSGLLAYLYDGPGNAAPPASYTGGVPIVPGGFSGVGSPSYGTTPVTYVLTAPSLSGGAQTTTTSIEILCYLVPRWVRITLLNLDPLNNCTINVVGDLP